VASSSPAKTGCSAARELQSIRKDCAGAASAEGERPRRANRFSSGAPERLRCSLKIAVRDREALSGFRRRGMPVFSSRSPALDGVSWAQGGLVEIAVGQRLAHATQIGAFSAPLSGAAPCGSSMRSPVWWIDSLSRCELGFVPPHRVHDDCEATSQSDAGLAVPSRQPALRAYLDRRHDHAPKPGRPTPLRPERRQHAQPASCPRAQQAASPGRSVECRHVVTIRGPVFDDVRARMSWPSPLRPRSPTTLFGSHSHRGSFF
jgi:hypothetical protein